MSVEIKYTVAKNSKYVKEPKQATSGSTGYDLFAAELKTLIPHEVTPVSIELNMEILIDALERFTQDLVFSQEISLLVMVEELLTLTIVELF